MIQYGPFSRHELRGLAKKGKFTPGDWVWHDEDNAWVHAEQLNELKSLFSDESVFDAPKSTVMAIGGGKGGVGKTVMTASIGVALASLGNKVVMVDADLGGANLHTVMGILEPEYTFFDFYTLQRESLNDIILETNVQNLGLISGACGTLGLANPKYSQKLRFIKQLRSVDADFLLLDLGAGSSYNIIDFFLAADEGIIVTNPDPMAIQEAFNFIKVCLLEKLKRAFHGNKAVTALLDHEEITRPGRMQVTLADVLEKVNEIDERTGDFFQQVLESYRPKLLLNMVAGPKDVKEGVAIQAAAAEILNIDVNFIGFVSQDQSVREAVRSLKPFLLQDPKSQASQDLSKLINVKMLGKSMFKSLWEKRKLHKRLQEEKNKYPELNLSDKAPTCSVRCFYWGDCEYQNGGHPCTVRHLEPIFKG